MVLAQPFRMCQILFFRHKKHLFDRGRELEQLRSIEKVFFMYNVLGSTGIAGGLLLRSLRSLTYLKALISQDHPLYGWS